MVEDPIAQQLLSAKRLRAEHLVNLVKAPNRERVSCLRAVADLHVDISQQLLDDEALDELLGLAKKVGFEERRKALFDGDIVNETEQQPALHMALRSAAEQNSFGAERVAAVHQTLAIMSTHVDALTQGRWLGATAKPIRTLVHIGIGGSHLGPKLMCQALQPYALGRIAIHYVDNIDSASLSSVLAQIDPEQTLFVVVSKSFTSQEVLANMHSARAWLLERGIPAAQCKRHFLAVTAHPERAQASGVDFADCLQLWEWVSGRFSLWSAVSLAVAVHIGMQGFVDFLSGARQIDQHFQVTPMADNLPLLLALTDIWNAHALNSTSHAIVPYSKRLELLPAYLQQLQMESNGKRVSRAGKPLRHRTSSVWWGGAGTNGQHSYYQFLHQGTEQTAMDFILCLSDQNCLPDHQDWLVSACLAQSTVLAKGNLVDSPEEQDAGLDAHQWLPGNRPSNTIVLPALTPAVMGQLLALFEHRIFCQSVLWDINPFDQFGVERGKQITASVYTTIVSEQPAADAFIEKILSLYRAVRR